VVLVSGTREHAEALREQVSDVIAPVGLRLSPEKTTVVHIDDGFDFLGFRIQRHLKPGTGKRYVYTFAAKKSVASVRSKVRTITKQGTNHALGDLLRQLNPVLRGWTAYFQHAVAKTTFGHLRHYLWNRVTRWLRQKHRKSAWKALRRRYGPTGWSPSPRSERSDVSHVGQGDLRHPTSRLPTPRARLAQPMLPEAVRRLAVNASVSVGRDLERRRR